MYPQNDPYTAEYLARYRTDEEAAKAAVRRATREARAGAGRVTEEHAPRHRRGQVVVRRLVHLRFGHST